MTGAPPLLGDSRVLRADADTVHRCPAFLQQHIEKQARRRPDSVALVHEGRHLSYGVLWRRVRRLARRLQEAGVGPEVLVGVGVDRSLELIVSILGVLEAGGAYLPLDPSYPPERLAFMVEDSGLELLVADATFPLPAPRRVRRLDPRPPELDGGAEEADGLSFEEPSLADLAYVIYTSGSTGRPKGVAVEHRGLANLHEAQLGTFGVRAGDRVLQFAPASFDASVFEIAMAMRVGATLVLAPQDRLLPGTELCELLRCSRITHLTIPPSVLAVLPRTDLPCLTCLVCAGEALPRELVARWGAGRSLFNAYGPTEATVWATVHRCRGDEERPPIGQPIPGASAEVVGPDLRRLPPGEPGELVVGGAGVARGYLGRPAWTASWFVPDPFGGEAGGRLYRTGDLARRLSDERLEFLGRVDQQVKIRGHRIEPSEVEAALGVLPGVREAVVIARLEEGGEPVLFGYVVPQGPRPPTVRRLRRELATRLPAHMVPARFLFLDALPRLPNGKVDRRSMPVPAGGRPELGTPYEAPRSNVEAVLAELWSELTGVGPIGVHDHFLEVGGDSLLATRIAARASERLGVELSPVDLLRASTIAELARRLEEGWTLPSESVVPGPSEERGPAPLAYSQEQVWFLCQVDPENLAYQAQCRLAISGPLAPTALQGALSDVLRRHEILRTSFPEVDDRPVQVVHPPSPARLPVIDLQGLVACRRTEEAARIEGSILALPFDLERAPLVHWTLLRHDPRHHALVQVEHHLVHDGWSFQVFLRDLFELYRARVTGTAPRLPPLPVRFTDFARWQRRWLESSEARDQLEFWKRKLEGAASGTALPTDRPRRRLQRFQGAAPRVELAPDLCHRLRNLADAHGTTFFMVLFAAFVALLRQHGGGPDMVLGTGVANRRWREIEDLLGMVINVIALRIDAAGDPGFAELLEAVRKEALEAYAHQDMPFEKVVEALRLEPDLSRNPIFQVLFNFHDAPILAEPPPGLEVKVTTALSNHSAKFDLNVILIPRIEGPFSRAPDGTEGATLVWEYDSDLFDATTIARMIRRFRLLLTGIADEPNLRLLDLPLLTPAERHQVRYEWGEGPPPVLEGPLVHELIADQVRRRPTEIAVELRGRRLTYRELWTRAGGVAGELARQNLGRGSLVAVLGERGPGMLAAILGTLRAGAAWVPLDLSHPDARLQTILLESGASVLAADAERVGRARRLAAALPGRPGVVSWDEAGDGPADPPHGGGRGVGPGDPAYVFYTSGSTGTPKGAVVTHEGMVQHVLAKVRLLGLGLDDVVAQNASHAFDISIWQYLAPLVAGGRVVVYDAETALDPGLLLRAMEQDGATVLETVPSLLEAALTWLESGPGSAVRLPRLRYLVSNAETLPPALARRWFDRFPSVVLINTYGATECADDTTHALLQAPPHPDAFRVPVGRPIQGMRLTVVTGRGREAGIGCPGEIVMAGMGVGGGYLGDARRTAAAFVPDPGAETPGARAYRSGDLGYWSPDGQLQFLGRTDRQIKVRGQRVELGEIEAALERHRGVRQAVVAVRSDEGALAAYYVAAQPLEPEELRAHLRGLLPGSMVPESYTALPRMPLTPNGKIDREALPRPALPSPVREHVEPRTGMEKRVAAVWSEVLGARRVGLHDDFFALGGQSLTAVQVAGRLRRELNVEFPLRLLFEHSQLDRQAEALTAQLLEAVAAEPGPPGEERIPQADDAPEHPLSLPQRGLWLLHRMDPESTFYNLAFPYVLSGALDRRALEAALSALVERHESLRTSFHWSEGGEPVQRIEPARRLALPRVELGALRPEGRLPAVRQAVVGFADRPFSLARAPVRVLLLSLKPERHLLLLVLHHLITDGWSERLIFRDLWELYQAARQGRPPDLPELPIRYVDFAAWQRRRIARGALADHERYWLDRLSGRLPPLDVAGAGGAAPPFPGGIVRMGFRLEPDAAGKLRRLAERSGATPFMVELALFKGFLARLTGAGELLIGVPAAGRDRPETEGVVGPFVNTLALRTRIDFARSCLDLIQRCREVALSGFAHQDYPFDMLVERLGPERSATASPLFQAFFGATPEPDTPAVAGLEVRPAAEVLGQGAVARADRWRRDRVDLRAGCFERADGCLDWELVFRGDLFDRSTARRLTGQLEAFARAALARPEVPLSALDLVSPAERREQTLRKHPPRPRYPLSFSQRDIWVQSRIFPESTLYNSVLAPILHGPIDPARLREAVRRVWTRNPGLRATFAVVDGEPVQRIVGEMAVPFEHRDFGTADEAAGRPGANEWTHELVAGRYDLERGPLLRVGLARLGADRYRLVVAFHHLVSDALSILDLASSILDEYERGPEAEATGAPAAEGPSFLDFALWQVRRFEAGEVERHRRYWSERLNGQLPATGLPIDRERPRHRTFEMESLELYFRGTELARLDEARRRMGTSTFRLFTAALYLLLWRWTGDARQLVGVPVAFRPPEMEGKIGCFANTPPVGIDLAPEATGAEVIGRVDSAVLEAREHADFPIAEVVRALGTAVTDVARPLVPVCVAQLRPFVRQAGAVTTAHEETAIPEALGSSFDLWLVIVREADRVRVVLQYDAALFERATVVRLTDAYRTLLAGLVADPGVEIGRLDVLTPAQREQLLELARLRPTAVESSPSQEPEAAPMPAGVEALRDELEAEVTEAWRRVLGVEEVALHRPFFELGGHSLKAVQLAVELQRRLDVEVPVRLVFEHPYIASQVQALVSRSAAAHSATGETIPRLEGPGPFPLSYAQQGFWMLHELDPRATFFNGVECLEWRGPLDRAALEGALAALVRRHPALRTGFEVVDGRPVQRLHEAVPGALRFERLVGHGPGKDRARVDELVRQVADQPFALSTPPVRFLLAGLGEEHHLLLLVLHHIVTDPESIVILRRELLRLYEAEVSGEQARLPDLPIRFVDFAAWQRERVESGSLAEEERYWCERLAGPLPAIDLPGDRPRGGGRSVGMRSLRRHLPSGLVERLDQLARASGATPFMLRLAVVFGFLYRITGERDLRLGVPASGRARPELAGVVGPLVNTLVVRVAVDPEAAAADLVERVRRTCLEAFARQDLPFERLTELLASERGGSGADLIPAFFVAARDDAWKHRLDGVEVGPGDPLPSEVGPGDPLPSEAAEERLGGGTAGEADLRVGYVERGGGEETWGFHLRRDRFDDATCDRLICRFATFLEELCRAPDQPLAEVAVLSVRERAELTLRRRPAREPYPLSFNQRDIWFHSELHPGAPYFNCCLSMDLRGPLDRRHFARAWRDVVGRHPGLSAVFFRSDGRPLQRVRAGGGPEVTWTDLTAVPIPRRAAATAWEPILARREFDLERGPLVRVGVARLEPGFHRVLVVVHHLVIDAVDLVALVRDALDEYGRPATGSPSSAPEVDYLDYASWQQALFEAGALDREAAFWARRLRGCFPTAELPLDHPRPEARSFRPACRTRALPAGLADRLASFRRERGSSMFRVLFTAFAALVARLSGRADVVPTLLIARRPSEAEGIRGFFANPLPLRIDVRAEDSVDRLIEAVGTGIAEAARHADYPLTEVLSRLPEVERSANRPLFPLCVSQIQSFEPGCWGDLKAAEGNLYIPGILFDLWLLIERGHDRLRVRFEYDAELFDPTTVERLLERFEILLEGVLNDPARAIGDLELLTPLERVQVLREWSSRERPYPRESSLPALFAEVAGARPEAVAVSWTSGALSYRELDRRARRLASRLQALDVSPDELVAVSLDRSPAMIVALLGVLQAGAAYAPLEPEAPPLRLRQILQQVAAPVLVTTAELRGELEGEVGFEGEIVVLDDRGSLPAPLGRKGVAQRAVNPLQRAYVNFTSGTTGVPKGVVVPQRAVARLVQNADYATLWPDDAVLQVSTYAWDAATFEVWGALLNGGRLALVPRTSVVDIDRLGDELSRERITALYLTTALFNQVVDRTPESLMGLRVLIVGGETASVPHFRAASEILSQTRLINEYGPSENTAFSTWERVAQVEGGIPAIPIGRPIANSTVYVMDARLRAVPPGVPGEICLGGDGLAREYLGRPASTAEAFVPSPFGEGERLYRTGDLGRWGAGGRLDFLGRRDLQVKIRGHRIELAEVEEGLRQHPAIRDAAVSASESFRSHSRSLTAYLVVAQGADGTPSVADLRAFLEDRLPGYMVPGRFVILDALPLTPTGKVDRKALPTAGPDAGHETGSPYVPPRTEMERRVAAVWREVLAVDRVGLEDDFYLLGGHSLLTVRISSRLQQDLGLEIPLRLVFDHPTVEQQARALEALAEGGRRAPFEAIPRLPEAAHYPLSHAQRGLWVLYRLDPLDAYFNVPVPLLVEGDLDPAALGRALRALAVRHEALRTRFLEVEGQPVQQILESFRPEITRCDLGDGSPEERWRRWAPLASRTVHASFDLSRPPVRVLLAEVEPGRHLLLLLVLHHLLTDANSGQVLFEDLWQLYRAYRRADAPELPPPAPIRYVDYAAWHEERISSGGLAASERFWLERLSTGRPALDLPADRPRSRRPRGGTRRETVAVSASLAERLRQIARTRGATPFMVQLAVCYTLLSKLTGQDDLSVGIPVSGRDHPDTRRLVGFLINLIVLRADCGGDPTFQELLDRVKEAAVTSYAHAAYPFALLVDRVNPKRDPDQTPLFEVMFNEEPLDLGRTTKIEGLEVSSAFRQWDQASAARNDSSTFARTDLELAYLEAADGGLAWICYFRRDRFDEATTRRYAGYLLRLLEQVAEAPLTHLSRLDLLDRAERTQVTARLARRAPGRGFREPAHALIAEQASIRPDAVAVVGEGGCMTFAELDLRAGRVACWLRRRGAGPETRVGLFGERGPGMLTAILGILGAGAAWVPLDPDQPDARLATILDTAGLRFIATQRHLGERTRRLLRGGRPEPSVLFWDAEAEGDEPITATSRLSEEGGAIPVAAENLAYVCFTSGSTGVPKGAMVHHGGMLNHFWSKIDTLALDQDSLVAQTASHCFDISVWQFLGALVTGGRVAAYDDATSRDPRALWRALERDRVTVLETVPSFLRVILEYLGQGEEPPVLALRALMSIGEVLPVSLCHGWHGSYPEIPLINAYGPAECSDTVTQHVLEGPPPADLLRVPLGEPLNGSSIHVLDRYGEPIPVGVAGQIAIGGLGAGRGYLAAPGRTAAAFRPDPFSAGAGLRLYLSGDRGRWRPDGTLEFLGRIDFQLKVRGNRIEPGEIESALCGHSGVRQAVVLLRSDEGGEPRLAAYWVGEVGVTDAELRRFLARRLPSYMLPERFVALEAMPVNRSGKVDRKALPAPEVGSHRAFVGPRDALELAVARVWEERLGRRAVGVLDDFFEIGGNSLEALSVLNVLRARLGADVPLRALFEEPTVAGLAAYIRAGQGESPRSPDDAGSLVRLQDGSPGRPPLFLVHPHGGSVFSYHPLARGVRREQVFGLQAPGLEPGEEPVASIPGLARRYCEEIRCAQPRGPYRIAGWSFGVPVAFEIARLLEGAGEAVSFFGVFDGLLEDPRFQARDTASDGLQERLRSLIELEMYGRQEGRLHGLPEEELLPLVFEEQRRRGIVPDDSDRATLERLYRVLEAHGMALLRYRPEGRVRADIELFRATEDTSVPEPEVWKAWTRGEVRVTEVPGTHRTLVLPPGSDVIAPVIRRRLGGFASRQEAAG